MGQQGSVTVTRSFLFYLLKLKDLEFMGKIEDWPEFRRNWQARFAKVPDEVQIQYLKPALPAKDQAKIAAVSTIAECWRRLEDLWR